MIRTAFLAAGLLGMCIPAFAGASKPIEFQLPSGNIGCIYIPEGGTPVYKPPGGLAELQCDRIAPTYIRVNFSAKGKAKVVTEPGEAPCCGGEVLPYGEKWTAGPFTCTSATNGLTCRRSERGFILSRRGARVF
jgi:hypothetical protein